MYAFITDRLRAVHLWSDHWGQMLIPSPNSLLQKWLRPIKLYNGVYDIRQFITVKEGGRIHTGFHNQSWLWLSFWARQGHPSAAFPTLSEIDTRWGCRPSAADSWTGWFCLSVRWTHSWQHILHKYEILNWCKKRKTRAVIGKHTMKNLCHICAHSLRVAPSSCTSGISAGIIISCWLPATKREK